MNEREGILPKVTLRISVKLTQKLIKKFFQNILIKDLALSQGYGNKQDKCKCMESV